MKTTLKIVGGLATLAAGYLIIAAAHKWAATKTSEVPQ